MSKPLAIDLYCGLGGWTEGLLAAGYDVIGFDIERHEYDGERYPGQLVIQDVRTLHGSQFKDAALIVASPPCQEYSYMAMPWTRAKAKATAIRADTTGEALRKLNELFDAAFRIQREASDATGRLIPLVVENVKGAQPWTRQAAWNFGSYHLWGDVPALMPIPNTRRMKFPGSAAPRMWRDRDCVRLNDPMAGAMHVRLESQKNTGGSWFNIGSPGQKVTNQNPVHRHRRKAASARIAKIPFPLAHWIGRAWYPVQCRPASYSGMNQDSISQGDSK